MQSPGAWTTVPSLAHQQSDDSGSEIDGFSLISANPELSGTSQLSHNAASNMPLPSSNDQSSSESLPPPRPAVVDWVEEQSLHDQTSGATGLQRACVGSVPPHAGQAKQAHSITNEPSSRQEGRQHSRKVYDIPTLLKLKETQSAVPVMLRVKPEAIAENIFQYMGAATSRRQATRSRGLSDISNLSAGNTELHNHTVYPLARPKYMTQPFRQPHAPPEGSNLQRHDGFVRFLKQHASPPHHRVTAGGRIVPAGPSSPPPMLDFGSLNGLLRDRPGTAKSSQKESHANQSNTRAQNTQITSSMSLGDYLQSQSGSADGMSLQHAPQPSQIPTSMQFNNLSFGDQPFMAPANQTQTSFVPLAMFPDGSTLVSYNGMNYRTSWNGSNTSTEPLQLLQLPVDQQYYFQTYPQGYLNNSQYGVVSQPSQVSVSSAPLASATNVARPDTSKTDLPLENDAQSSDEASLKAKLTNLDKHLALYHYDIMPADRASLIAQRVYLVAEIDRIRLSKAKPKHSIPIVAPAAGLPVTPAAQLVSDPKNNRISKGGTMSKHLSPAAPAFVPRNALNPSSTSFSMRTVSQHSKHQQFGMPAPSTDIGTASKAKDNASSSTWPSHSEHKPSLPNTERKSHNENSSSSSVLDPSDPAMRVIDHEDIEYAARYLYNWTKDTKTYCTTVAEFQEAIRRVREQARLYGCAGGQSKDPAYDAEQDLWWAICDRDPIPLPSKIPDHVANPRPWNWNDSAFNYRRQGANDVPGPGCEQARNSPRVLGWDPATTDKMKDTMDISRSSFALKGRLPSVSFRDSDTNRDGNKRLIQSDTAASNAYAPAAKDPTCLGNPSMAGLLRNDIRSSSGSSAPNGITTSGPNTHRTGSVINAPLKPAEKEKAEEPVSLPLRVPHTPEHSRTQQSFEASNAHFTTHLSKPNVCTGRRIVMPENTEANIGLHRAYIEEHPETPVVGGTRSASKAVFTPLIKTTPSNVRMEPLSTGSINAHTGSPVQANVCNYAGLSGPSWNAAEEKMNDIWYHTPLDEVTQKYLDDMRAYNPLKNKQADGNNHNVDRAKDRHQNSDSSEPVTESKSPWGPEEGATPTTPSGRNCFETVEPHKRAEEQGGARIAKVKIPNAPPLQAPTPRVNGNVHFLAGFNAHNALDSREFNAVNVPSNEGNDSHNFLRKMLKSPRYSSAQPSSIFSQIGATLADKINGTKRAQANSSAKQSENKGNTYSYKYSDTGIIGSRPYANSRPPSSASLARIAPNVAVSKAQSSLASSTYQAHGYLPQFDGAGKAHASSLYRGQGIQPLPQVRLPSEASYSDRQHITEASSNRVNGPSARTASTTYHSPVVFGYDGGRDSPPPNTTVSPKDQQSAHPSFDFKGVTLADYENQRADTNNAWHHGAVDDFFQDLHERELRTIASHQRVNTRSAA